MIIMITKIKIIIEKKQLKPEKGKKIKKLNKKSNTSISIEGESNSHKIGKKWLKINLLFKNFSRKFNQIYILNLIYIII